MVSSMADRLRMETLHDVRISASLTTKHWGISVLWTVTSDSPVIMCGQLCQPPPNHLYTQSPPIPLSRTAIQYPHGLWHIFNMLIPIYICLQYNNGLEYVSYNNDGIQFCCSFIIYNKQFYFTKSICWYHIWSYMNTNLLNV